MDSGDPFWVSEQVIALARAHDLGGLVKYVRQARHMTQQALAPQVNVSTSTLSRFESGLVKSQDVRLAKALAEKLRIPSGLIGVALGIDHGVSPNVGSSNTPAEEDPIHRRSFLSLTGLTVPARLLTELDNILAGVTPAIDAMPDELDKRLASARAMYDQGRNGTVLHGLPHLLRLADQELESDRPGAAERYCLVNDLATDLLDKVGLVGEARLTAQNSMRVSRQTGSPLAMAAAARGLTIVLRHEGKITTANRVSLEAAWLIERTGLVSARQVVGYVQVMCTHAYVAAQNDDRASALSAIAEAGRAASYLTGRAPADVVHRAIANAGMYRVSVHWALGDAGTAVAAARQVDARALPTPERQARHHTDIARAWWSWGKPDETAMSLLHAFSYAPAEVMDRPRIRKIADALTAHHLSLTSVCQLRDRIAGMPS